MSLGFLAARSAGSGDPGAMLAALGLGGAGALLMAMATVTTNFVNVYLSALAWKSLVPRAGEQLSVWSIGLVGAALSVGSRAWLDGYAGFMVVLGTLLVPVGGVLLAHFFVLKVPTDVAALYDPPAGSSRFPRAGLLAWALGGAAYHAGTPVGGTLPALIASAAAYTVLARWDARRRRRYRDVQESRGTPAM
jgi:purine-cytosine permease-like protein